jgi:hypothetical protein
MTTREGTIVVMRRLPLATRCCKRFVTGLIDDIRQTADMSQIGQLFRPGDLSGAELIER